jgi:plasmid maintenance system antidote protein VapI
VSLKKIANKGRGKYGKLAATAKMSAPKISAMENEPRNLSTGTLIRVAHALGSRVEIKLVLWSGTEQGRQKLRKKSPTPRPS